MGGGGFREVEQNVVKGRALTRKGYWSVKQDSATEKKMNAVNKRNTGKIRLTVTAGEEGCWGPTSRERKEHQHGQNIIGVLSRSACKGGGTVLERHNPTDERDLSLEGRGVTENKCRPI